MNTHLGQDNQTEHGEEGDDYQEAHAGPLPRAPLFLAALHGRCERSASSVVVVMWRLVLVLVLMLLLLQVVLVTGVGVSLLPVCRLVMAQQLAGGAGGVQGGD